MRDGRVVALEDARAFDRNRLIATMGSVADGESHAADGPVVRDTQPVVVRATPAAARDSLTLAAHRGEVVGLAGLSGQGQTELLVEVFDRTSATTVDGDRVIASDRQTDGVFALWSIAENISIGSLRAFLRGPLLDHQKMMDFARDWRERMGIRTPDVNQPILSLSGGNQQKALFARALGSSASIIVMDDPMRGVDVGTKQEVYGMIREEAAGGRTFLWYTTEMDELRNCDHVYVFRDGAIVADLPRAGMTEERVIQASFRSDT
ncbi:MAG: ATP-binding cassette domain-containing protein [Geminicoccaceae bacterium]